MTKEHTPKKGAHGIVRKMLVDSQPVAVKESPLTREGLSEAKIVQLLQGHPNIIRVHNVEITEEVVRTTMDFIPKTLLDLTSKAPEGLPRERVFHIFWQLVNAVKFIHSKGIAHKDLKLENILTDATDKITIIDFGFSRFFDAGSRTLKDNKGSLHYAAPELWHRHYYEGPEVDVWAMGVILFLLSTGYFPFGGSTAAEIYHDIEARELWLPPSLKSDPLLVQLLCQMLESDLDRRLTVDQILDHPWVVSQKPLSVPSFGLSSSNDRILSFNSPKESSQSRDASSSYHIDVPLSHKHSGDLISPRIGTQTPRSTARQSPRGTLPSTSMKQVAPLVESNKTKKPLVPASSPIGPRPIAESSSVQKPKSKTKFKPLQFFQKIMN